MSVSQLFAIKLNDDNYKFEIQLNVEKSEMDPILSFIKGMNYKQIQQWGYKWTKKICEKK